MHSVLRVPAFEFHCCQLPECLLWQKGLLGVSLRTVSAGGYSAAWQSLE